MRILAVTVSNVGGLSDGRLVLPAGSITALAGANGTGKSKLLACILAPWTTQIPAPSNDTLTAEVLVELKLDLPERVAINEFSRAINWGEVDIPELIQIGVRRHKMTGQVRFSSPEYAILHNLWNQPQFLAAQPSLNVVYLPAERRLLEPIQPGIDLNQLSEAMAFEKGAQSRNAVGNYGRLDDQEFESFAKALCVAASLPDDQPSPQSSPPDHERIDWERFRTTVNGLIAPKELLGLTRSHPDELRIQTLRGDIHSVRDLSSGERQALIIISRILRAGTSAPLVMIDEPDAYLHPNLSRRLSLALEEGVGASGQLIVATHSPAILDSIPPAAIFRLEHGGPPQAVADETQRLELYRQAGFRSSALTQSDLLLITEGSMDATILNLAIPELSRASVQYAGGKTQVIREVKQLKPFSLPVLGVVDRDLNLTVIEESIKSDIFVWPTADIEGVYLSEAASLEAMIDLRLIKSTHRSLNQLQELITSLCESQRVNVIAEIARDKAVLMSGHEWPTPRGNDPLLRLREAVRVAQPISSDQLEAAIADAEEIWNNAQENRLRVVRGKYIFAKFVAEASEMRSAQSLLEAVARHRPPISAIQQLTHVVTTRLNQTSSPNVSEVG